jgi:predicted nucleotidyltransferase
MITSSIVRTAPPALAPLFRSDGQARILIELFLADPGTELSITDLAEQAGVAYGSVHREVTRLLAAGLLAERRVGAIRLIHANGQNPLVEPLRSLIQAAAGPVPLLTAELSAIDGVEQAFLFGSYAARLQGVAGDPPNDIDVMVIGTPEPAAIYAACRRVRDQIGRAVSPTIMTRQEAGENTGFLTHIRAHPTVPLITGEAT